MSEDIESFVNLNVNTIAAAYFNIKRRRRFINNRKRMLVSPINAGGVSSMIREYSSFKDSNHGIRGSTRWREFVTRANESKHGLQIRASFCAGCWVLGAGRCEM